MKKEVREYLSMLGKKGGKSKSEKKLKALEANRAKWSLIARWGRDAQSK
jgi:hypothetical protein